MVLGDVMFIIVFHHRLCRSQVSWQKNVVIFLFCLFLPSNRFFRQTLLI